MTIWSGNRSRIYGNTDFSSAPPNVYHPRRNNSSCLYLSERKYYGSSFRGLTGDTAQPTMECSHA
jgi:hypothetical protein